MRLRWIVLLVIVVGLAALITWQTLQPDATVLIVRPVRETIREFVEEQAVTELPRDYLIAAPIAGWLEPIELREGDPVQKGQVVARLDPADLEDRIEQIEHQIAEFDARIAKAKDNTLEQNALIQATAVVKAVDETVQAADAKLEASRAVLEFAESEVTRIQQLQEAGAAPPRELRQAETQVRQARADYRSDGLQVAALKTLAAVSYLGPKFITDFISQKRYDVQTYEQQRNQARAELEIARRNLERASITSPIDGVVLARHQTRRQYLAAGTPLLVLGRLEDLEVIAEVLTERAMQIAPGNPVEVFGEAFGQRVISGKVLRVYPAGFKKISSLGVEQQRVNVAIGIDERPERLGVGYRVYVRIKYAEANDALVLPRTALFRGGSGGWQVMIVRNGVTELRDVELGLRNDDKAQILTGLDLQDAVIAQPSREIVAGMRVAVEE
ncbi:MAG TPA: efflux RND transporter periplasmic adaptor subunit [Phycisphaerae bacterium]|nr:efflux RND transporter periplasmic adaptor subunit [Phycisphaerae bacterium]HOJ72766.1 efflux RND transporter periplasmic adaptor subunit [Phycisphaerae bacterium]HOM51807.1 efflux RND transporter periplasmic adaptor subunit [Phycisphaerae bacterium]HON65201.1 efflux RND transporter periplasmic adaptor subunit [Phycisphaerae bacterium]HOQ84385.1 efflux RND transporter periplasmic adaptor subunit [Phycisphaerae bacterium]